MMVACCVLTLLTAGAVVLTGTVGIGGIVFASACAVMMVARCFRWAENIVIDATPSNNPVGR